MKPFETLDSVSTPDGHRLTLHHRDGDYYICLDGEELISTRAPGSESALGRMGCAGLMTAKAPRVLIGGLGLGYTLRAALEVLPPRAEVVVAEVFPAVASWNRGVLSHLHAGALDDPRVAIVERDVGMVIAEAAQRPFDAILLDIDNGPEAWCLESNGRLYGDRGLATILRALRADGVLGIWSSDADPRFIQRLRRNGFEATMETVRSRGRKGTQHTIFMARRRVEGPSANHQRRGSGRGRKKAAGRSVSRRDPGR